MIRRIGALLFEHGGRLKIIALIALALLPGMLKYRRLAAFLALVFGPALFAYSLHIFWMHWRCTATHKNMEKLRMGDAAAAAADAESAKLNELNRHREALTGTAHARARNVRARCGAAAAAAAGE